VTQSDVLAKSQHRQHMTMTPTPSSRTRLSRCDSVRSRKSAPWEMMDGSPAARESAPSSEAESEGR
jgi:hypothetical protein